MLLHTYTYKRDTRVKLYFESFSIYAMGAGWGGVARERCLASCIFRGLAPFIK